MKYKPSKRRFTGVFVEKYHIEYGYPLKKLDVVLTWQSDEHRNHEYRPTMAEFCNGDCVLLLYPYKYTVTVIMDIEALLEKTREEIDGNRIKDVSDIVDEKTVTLILTMAKLVDDCPICNVSRYEHNTKIKTLFQQHYAQEHDKLNEEEESSD